MNLTRRSLITGAGLLGLAAGLSACGREASDGSAAARQKALTMWYWSGGLSDQAVKDTAASFAGRAEVSPQLVSGDFKQQLVTSLASGRSVPDITGIKGEDMPMFLTMSRDFLDLNTLGAREIAGSFAQAKYAQATTPDGRQIGLPIDLGPTALFFRADLWAQAGLPAAPTAVGGLTQTWDDWFETAHRLKKALPGTFAIRSSNDVFATALSQQPETFMSRDGHFVGDGAGVKQAWNLAVRSISAEVQAGIYDQTAFNTALATGILTGHIGPAWNGLDIESGAPHTSGSWRVAPTPSGPGNIGGSYLTLTRTCRAPELAFAFVTDLLSPANESKGFADTSLFPAVTASYSSPALTKGQKFYGGQSIITVLGPAAENLPEVYNSPLDAAISTSYTTELNNVEGGKNPREAWNDAVAAGSVTARSANPQA